MGDGVGEGFEQSMNDDMDAEPNMTQKKEKSNQPGGELRTRQFATVTENHE